MDPLSTQVHRMALLHTQGRKTDLLDIQGRRTDPLDNRDDRSMTLRGTLCRQAPQGAHAGKLARLRSL